jgi:hypothetical protein
MCSPRLKVLRKRASALTHKQEDSMAKFGRFEFGEDKPSETYEGDGMTLEKGCVKIMRGGLELIDFQTGQLVAVIYLDKGQSMREIGTD